MNILKELAKAVLKYVESNAAASGEPAPTDADTNNTTSAAANATVESSEVAGNSTATVPAPKAVPVSEGHSETVNAKPMNP